MVEPQANTTRTIVTFLLDESGSMDAIKSDTIGGFNTYVQTLRESGNKIKFTLVKFDTQEPYNVLFSNLPITEVPRLSTDNYKPRGSTPLVDSAYRAIKATEAHLSWEDTKPNVLVVIQTDGEENASHEHTTAQLKQLIEEKQGMGWQFVFMGAGINAYAQAGSYGINLRNTSSYGMQNSAQAFSNLASNTASWAASGCARDINYTSAQLKGQGDVYADEKNNLQDKA